jgi:hypothetical protein
LSLRSQAEAHLQRQQARAIKHLLNRGLGSTVRVWSQPQDDHQKAYGAAAGTTASTYREIRGIDTGDDFFPADTLRSGSFQEGWLWTDDPEVIEAGQRVEFIGEDGRSRHYHVTMSESIGWTTEIFTRYRLAAVDQP